MISVLEHHGLAVLLAASISQRSFLLPFLFENRKEVGPVKARLRGGCVYAALHGSYLPVSI